MSVSQVHLVKMVLTPTDNELELQSVDQDIYLSNELLDMRGKEISYNMAFEALKCDRNFTRYWRTMRSSARPVSSPARTTVDVNRIKQAIETNYSAQIEGLEEPMNPTVPSDFMNVYVLHLIAPTATEADNVIAKALAAAFQAKGATVFVATVRSARG